MCTCASRSAQCVTERAVPVDLGRRGDRGFGGRARLRNLPIEQTFYARIAVVRRGSVQSLWTPVLQIVVR